jgi:CBS-domain-containing membrane protein
VGGIMQVKDIMTTNVISIGADEPIVKAASLMLQNRISGLPVVDKEGELVGMVTEGDFPGAANWARSGVGRNGSNSLLAPANSQRSTCTRQAEKSKTS